MKPYKILFITHEAKRSGAPLLLLRLLEWLKCNKNISFDILIIENGILANDFSKLGKTYHWSFDRHLFNFIKNTEARRLIRLISRILLLAPNLIKQFIMKNSLIKNKYDIVFFNSLASLKLAPTIHKNFNCPKICHVTELNYSANNICNIYKYRNFLPKINLYITVSNLVSQFLECELGIPNENIQKISSFSGKIKQQSNKQILRNILNIPDNAFVVYASGNIHWIKGTDVFIQLAAQVNKITDTNIYFIWVGGCEHSEYMAQLLYDISHLGLMKTIKITGQLEEPWPYYAASDLFVLTSREDAFPQVALEAAMLSIPCVCFDGVSGVRDFVNDKTGSLVPYLDIDQMAKEIVYYYKNPDILMEKGNNIRRAVDFYTFKHTGNQFYDAFKKVVQESEI